MKLLTAATRSSLRAALLISGLGGALFYVGFRQRIYEEVDEELGIAGKRKYGSGGTDDCPAMTVRP